MKYVLLVPALVFCSLFTIWPLGEIVVLSMTKTNFITSSFVWFDNYVALISDGTFIQALGNSLFYIALMVPLTVGSALGIALMVMHQEKRWHDRVRIFLYVPVLASGIILAQVWRWIYHIEGPINALVELFGFDAVQWFGSAQTAIPAIAIVVAVSSIGTSLIVILAGILRIDQSLFDAARVDGCTPRQMKFHVVVPIIAPELAVMALLTAIAAPQIFETIYALAPYEYSATMGWAIYVEAFQMSRHGSAAAMSFVLLVVMMSLALMRKRVEAK